jgi:hypothetical protein
MAKGSGILTLWAGFSWGCSLDPIWNSPFGTTTSGGQKSQSLNLNPAGDVAEASGSGGATGSAFARRWFGAGGGAGMSGECFARTSAGGV